MPNRTAHVVGSVLLILAVAGIGVFWTTTRDHPQESAQEVPGFVGSDVAQTAIPLDAPVPIPMTIYLSPTCGCCEGWVDHIATKGFEVTLEFRENMTPIKEEFGVRPEHSSCHTAVVNGYVVEGHVPGDVVRRFLAEAPAVRGLTAPGMPIGSPGMEAGDAIEPYDVLTFTSEGRTQVYSREGRN
jgi:hypothetical protein